MDDGTSVKTKCAYFLRENVGPYACDCGRHATRVVYVSEGEVHSSSNLGDWVRLYCDYCYWREGAKGEFKDYLYRGYTTRKSLDRWLRKMEGKP